MREEIFVVSAYQLLTHLLTCSIKVLLSYTGWVCYHVIKTYTDVIVLVVIYGNIWIDMLEIGTAGPPLSNVTKYPIFRKNNSGGDAIKQKNPESYVRS